MPPSEIQAFLRERHGHAHVTHEELFFDLRHAFATTQRSQRLLAGGLASLVMVIVAVWQSLKTPRAAAA